MDVSLAAVKINYSVKLLLINDFKFSVGVVCNSLYYPSSMHAVCGSKFSFFQWLEKAQSEL